MNRLQLELDRLYPTGTDDARVLVLELKQPAGWEQLSTVWKGVQADLALPAPAIAISGTDAMQLWFAVAAPVARDAGAAFLEALRARYLPDVDPVCVRMFSEPSALAPRPPVATGPERWSAFVTPDLAAVFADTPWLDIPPGEDGQATLLRAIQPMPADAFEAALALLAPAAAPLAGIPAPAASPEAPASPARGRAHAGAMRFLEDVMGDETAPLALRVDAAKALLPYPGD